MCSQDSGQHLLPVMISSNWTIENRQMYQDSLTLMGNKQNKWMPVLPYWHGYTCSVHAVPTFCSKGNTAPVPHQVLWYPKPEGDTQSNNLWICSSLVLLQAAWAGAPNIEVFPQVCHCLSALFSAILSANCMYFLLPKWHVPCMKPKDPIHGYPCVGRVPCRIILCSCGSMFAHKTESFAKVSCQWLVGRRGCWVVLPLNYLLTASLGTMATVAQTRESLRTALNWITASHLQEKKGDVLVLAWGWGAIPLL